MKVEKSLAIAVAKLMNYNEKIITKLNQKINLRT